MPASYNAANLKLSQISLTQVGLGGQSEAVMSTLNSFSLKYKIWHIWLKGS